MPLNPSFIVRMERKPGAFGETMHDIRSWLDHCKIQPASFAPVADSGVGFEISFKSEDEARLFEHAFRASTRLPRGSTTTLKMAHRAVDKLVDNALRLPSDREQPRGWQQSLPKK